MWSEKTRGPSPHTFLLYGLAWWKFESWLSPTPKWYGNGSGVSRRGEREKMVQSLKITEDSENIKYWHSQKTMNFYLSIVAKLFAKIMISN